MADSDEYGDEFDDTEFLVAATQAEKENTPVFQVSPRPTKRRKVGRANERTAPKQNGPRNPSVSSDEEDAGNKSDWSLPEEDDQNESRLSNGNRENEHPDDEESENVPPARPSVAQQRRERIHVPTTNLDMKDVFFTQPPQEHSPPWKPRGAIWAKPTTSIGIHKPSEPPKQPSIAVNRTTALPNRQSPLSRSNPPVLVSSGISNYSLELGRSPKLKGANGTGEDYDFTKDLADLPSDAFSSPDSSPRKEANARQRVVAPQTGLRQTTLFGRAGANGQIPPSQVNKRYNFVVDQKQEPPTHHKLDPEAMKTWVYPTNLGAIRDYQFNIVQRGLFNNLLVALPTGLGKTFIAATIMLNWYRWTTEAQIIFVAPTKPLVSQQIEACCKIAGLPRSATTMLIGGVSQGVRAEEWKEKRVFFMTPQTLMVDLKAGYVEPKKIVLLVVDEAHRATGAYAYVEVVSFLRRFNASFRVLALTATPGADVEAVQKVIDGLDISKVEIRTENSMDICSYVHQRKIEKHVFQNSDEMEMCMDLYSQALQPLAKTIAGMNAYWSSDPIDFTPFGCQQARAKYMKGQGLYANAGVKATVHSIFTILASISHGMELLKYHGMGSFYIKMKEFQEEAKKGKSKYKKQVLDSDAWKKLMVRLHGWVNDDNFVGHPKLEFVQQVILDHFVNAGDGRAVEGAAPSQTRIMVFAHFRDSAEEIARVLKRHDPMIRPRVFVGQSTGKNSEGMSQKEQLAVIEQFKAGTYNTLIATSIGEEGLDIGEVDLIICYDSKASPIRMLQRMGRTGRKREGKIVMLQMQGKEENDANKAKDSYEKMQEIIANGSHFTFHDETSRRILPPDVRPVVDRRIVDIPSENSQVENWLPEPKKGRKPKKPPKKFHMPDDVLTGFVKAGNMGEEIKPKPREKKAAAPVYPSEELVDLPPLESVFLDEKTTTDLERRYQTVFDDDDAPIVGALDLGAHYDRQRTASRTEFLSAPGRASRSFVSTMQRMHHMDEDRLDLFKQNLHYSDCESDAGNTFLVSDAEMEVAIDEDMWADDDPASQTLRLPSKTKAKPGPKPKAKPKTPAKTAAKTSAKADAKTDVKKSAKTPTKPAAPRGRPPGKKSAQETPVHLRVLDEDTPAKKTPTPNWRVSGLAQEGDESSPPPTDPRWHIASQADTIGSDDTMGEDEVQDTQAYLLDSELASFIVEDEDDVDVPASSLPSLDLSGIGRGTQAVVRAARPTRQPRREKIFTSDPTDDDAVVSSDSDEEDISLVRPAAGPSKKHTIALDDTSSDEEAPIIPKKRVRRVIDDDEDDDE